MAWHSMALHGVAWHGMVWRGSAKLSVPWRDVALHSVAQKLLEYSTMSCGIAWARIVYMEFYPFFPQLYF